VAKKTVTSSVYGVYSKRLAWQFVNLDSTGGIKAHWDSPNVLPWGINKSENILYDAIRMASRWTSFKTLHSLRPGHGLIKLSNKLGITYWPIVYGDPLFTTCISDTDLEELLNSAPSFK